MDLYPERPRDSGVSLNAYQPEAGDILIAVTGLTGAGKSTFISHCTDAAVTIGHKMYSETQHVQAYLYAHGLERNIYLIDSPGFDDSTKDDTTILREIAMWLGKIYENKVQLRGILYLHPITDNRMRGSARNNLFMFKKLCGKAAEKNVVLATTMWEKLVNPKEGQGRKEQLKSEYWGAMIENGSKMVRHYNNIESAITIVDKILSLNNEQPTVLAIQYEMVDEGKQLIDTGAGQELHAEFTELQDRSRKEISEFEKDMREAHEAQDREAQEQIRLLIDERDAKIRQLEQQQESMRANLEQLHQQKCGELERKIKAQDEISRLTTAWFNKRYKITFFAWTGKWVDGHPSGYSLSLCGEFFTFVGPKYHVRRFSTLALDSSNRQRGKYDSIIVRGVCLGPNDAFIRIFDSTGGTGIVADIWSGARTHVCEYVEQKGGSRSKARAVTWKLGEYPPLDKAITELTSPVFASLGPDGTFFYRTKDRTVSNLTKGLCALAARNKLDKVWLGYKGSWVAYRTEESSSIWTRLGRNRVSHWLWDLKGHYKELEKVLNGKLGHDMKNTRVEALALNVKNPEEFAFLCSEGVVAQLDEKKMGVLKIFMTYHQREKVPIYNVPRPVVTSVGPSEVAL